MPLARTYRSALESVAAYGSVSYGTISPERMKAVLLGAVPSEAEGVRVHQALSETPLYRVCTLAKELGLSFTELDARAQALFGQSLEQMNRWTPGGSS